MTEQGKLLQLSSLASDELPSLSLPLSYFPSLSLSPSLSSPCFPPSLSPLSFFLSRSSLTLIPLSLFLTPLLTSPVCFSSPPLSFLVLSSPLLCPPLLSFPLLSSPL